MTDQQQHMMLAGKFELQEKAGEGGMATVWRAVMHGAAGFTRYVAVKQIRPNLLSNREFVAMFVEEARVGSQLQHANIVQTYDFVQDGQGTYFLVLEWVEGVNFSQYLDAYQRSGHQCDWPLVGAIAVETLRGLGAAHERVDHHGRAAPVVHRDVTPQNILICTSGLVKLSDFGLARAMDRLRMTHPDVVKGKLRYMAPEITKGEPATEKSDLFSLGIVLWEALTGRPLYSGRTDAEVFKMAREAHIPPLQDLCKDLPEELVVIVHRALSAEPEQRFASAKEMLRGLTNLLRRLSQSVDAYTISKTVITARRFLGMPRPRTVPLPVIKDI